ncbi:MAG: FGGY-family carbohydrate kinase [Polyangiales bacterium]
MLYDIREGQWSEELAGILGVPTPLLPEVRSCAEVYARTKGVPVLPDGIPIAGMAGDQQAAGQTCFEVGDAKCTYGTGAFLLQNTGTTFVPSKNGLVTTIAWRLGGETVYALEGSAFIAGAAVQWLRDGLGVITKASRSKPGPPRSSAPRATCVSCRHSRASAHPIGIRTRAVCSAV